MKMTTDDLTHELQIAFSPWLVRHLRNEIYLRTSGGLPNHIWQFSGMQGDFGKSISLSRSWRKRGLGNENLRELCQISYWLANMSKVLSRPCGLTLVSWPESEPIQTYYRPTTKWEKSLTLETKMNSSTRFNLDLISSLPNPKAAFCASHDPSFKTARTDANDDITISACELVFNDESQLLRRSGSSCQGRGASRIKESSYRKQPRGKWRRRCTWGELCCKEISHKPDGNDIRRSAGWCST